MGHVGETYAEAVVVGANQRIGSLQVDVIADEHQRALGEAEIDASGGVGQDDGLDPHAGEDADRERDLLRGVSLVEVDAALHGGNCDFARFADYQAAGVSDGGGLWERRNFRVGDAGGIGERVGEGAEAGTEDEADPGAERRAFQD